MLEFLFNFIEQNIILVFFCVLFLATASIYSKRIKFLFFFLLGGAATYFALLCLYRLGIGIEALYNWSCDFVISICNQIDYCSLFGYGHSPLLVKVFEVVFQHLFADRMLCLIHLTFFISFALVMILILLPRLKVVAIKKIEIHRHYFNKKIYFSNTINSTQSKFILNSVFRC